MEIREDIITWDDEEGLKPKIKEGKRSKSSGSLSSEICLNYHTGTHADAPKHFLSKGSSIDEVQPEKLMGKCRIVDCTDREKEVKADDVVDSDEDILIFKTKNSEFLSEEKFHKDFIYVSEEACEKVIDYGYEAVGIDYLGIAEYGNSRAAHVALLGNGIVVVEGLDLRNIEPGSYKFVGLPLKIKGGDGSPIRAILKDLE